MVDDALALCSGAAGGHQYHTPSLAQAPPMRTHQGVARGLSHLSFYRFCLQYIFLHKHRGVLMAVKYKGVFAQETGVQ